MRAPNRATRTWPVRGNSGKPPRTGDLCCLRQDEVVDVRRLSNYLVTIMVLFP